MKKIVLGSFIFSGLLFANDGTISYEYGIKNYNNSMTKVDGKVQNIDLGYKVNQHLFNLGYQGDNVDRQHDISKINLPSLDVEKYNAKYRYIFSEKLNFKVSYIKIIDNLSPTDQGKVFGIGGNYTLFSGLDTAIDIYKSQYEDFDVNQYDVTISKAFKINDLKLKATIIAKKIDIDGQKYGSYSFKDKDYFTTGFKIGANYNGYFTGIGTFVGKRIFTVFNDGINVQHHAMQQDEMYMLSFGKKFKNFQVMTKYSYQNGKELPENRDNVDTQIISLSLSYKF